MDRQAIRRAMNLSFPCFRKMKQEMEAVEEEIAEVEDDFDVLKTQHNRDLKKAYTLEGQGDTQRATQYRELADRRKESLNQKRTALNRLYQKRKNVEDRVVQKTHEIIEMVHAEIHGHEEVAPEA